MANAAFDTFKYVQTLTQSHQFTQGQAEVLMEAQKEAFDGGVATREDVSKLRVELKEDIFAVKNEVIKLESKLDKSIPELAANINVISGKLNFLIRFIGIIASAVVIIDFAKPYLTSLLTK